MQNVLFGLVLFGIFYVQHVDGLRCYQNFTAVSFMWNRRFFHLDECASHNGTELSCVRIDSRVKALPGFGRVKYGYCAPTTECNDALCNTFNTTLEQINMFFRQLSCRVTCCNTDGCNGEMTSTTIATAFENVTTSDVTTIVYSDTPTTPNVTTIEPRDNPTTSDVTTPMPSDVTVHQPNEVTTKGGTITITPPVKVMFAVTLLIIFAALLN